MAVVGCWVYWFEDMSYGAAFQSYLAELNYFYCVSSMTPIYPCGLFIEVAYQWADIRDYFYALSNLAAQQGPEANPGSLLAYSP